ncbi:hypothetical protein [Salinibacterium sp. ZJ450]|uniref:hypothetical protein n=1 Tax=Salinibacterium sp. ZJ450 TaxID=2708338 RepID=UPI00141FAC5A|nr:hypothetical protein [Salinibacterium sp. ZJ450]
MITDPDREDDTLDALLTETAPYRHEPNPGILDELPSMVVGAEREARPLGVLRRMPRLAVAGVAAVLVLGGAGAAAAATFAGWSPWAQTPDAVYTYTLPSGAVCENRLGDVRGQDPAITEAIRTFVGGVDILAVADIDAALELMREQGTTQHLENGTEEPGGYGTVHYNADVEYNLAVNQAVSAVITNELLRQGFDLETDTGLSYAGESHCPGADW